MTCPHFNLSAYSLLVLLALAGCGEQSQQKGPKYRFAPIVRTDIVRTVEATGKVTPLSENTMNTMNTNAALP